MMGFAIAALMWIAWQLIRLFRTARAAAAQPVGERLAAHRFRLGTALGSGTAGVLLLYKGLGEAGPDGEAITTFHLLDALDTFLVYLGFALLLLSLLALFPPGGLALAGAGRRPRRRRDDGGSGTERGASRVGGDRPHGGERGWCRGRRRRQAGW